MIFHKKHPTSIDLIAEIGDVSAPMLTLTPIVRFLISFLSGFFPIVLPIFGSSCGAFFGQAVLVFSDSPFNPSREKIGVDLAEHGPFKC